MVISSAGVGSGVTVGVGGAGVAVGVAGALVGRTVGVGVGEGVLVGAGETVGEGVGVLEIAGRGVTWQALKSSRAKSVVSNCSRGFKMRRVLQNGFRF